MRHRFLLSAALLLLAVSAWAQGTLGPMPAAPPVQSSPEFPITFTTTATGAANTAVTATAPAGTGYFYLCYLHIVEVANAAVTGAAGPAPIFTTTNLPTNLVWWGDNATQGTGFQKVIIDAEFQPTCIKSALPNTATTVVTSAGQSTQSVRINLGGFYGP